MAKVSEVLQDRYRLDGVLGRGGMGRVYRAQDVRTGTLVAVKEMVCPRGLDPETRRELRSHIRAQAQVLTRLRHPHLIRVLDSFSDRRAEYLVVELIEGDSLAQLIERQGALPEPRVLAWARQLLDALIYCHSHNVVHHDVKPANVIIRPGGRAMLVDFGLSRIWDPKRPHTGALTRGMGTPGYAPLEQYTVQVGHTDPRSDIYSLGATLYHALTGKAPPNAALRRVSPGALRPIRTLNASIDAHIERVILQAMRLQMTERFQTARDMLAALDR